jgi:hypothetical protein
MWEQLSFHVLARRLQANVKHKVLLLLNQESKLTVKLSPDLDHTLSHNHTSNVQRLRQVEAEAARATAKHVHRAKQLLKKMGVNDVQVLSGLALIPAVLAGEFCQECIRPPALAVHTPHLHICNLWCMAPLHVLAELSTPQVLAAVNASVVDDSGATVSLTAVEDPFVPTAAAAASGACSAIDSNLYNQPNLARCVSQNVSCVQAALSTPRR